MTPVAGPVPTYVARFPGPFGALVQAPTLGGMRLEPLPAMRVHDVFWDTPEADLLAAGWVLRVRHREAPAGDGSGSHEVSLRGVRAGRPPVRLAGDPGDGLSDALADALAPALGHRPERLLPLFGLRQLRTPRVIYDGDRPVAVLLLDVIVADTGRPEGRVSHEARLRLTAHGGHADLIRIDPALREHGLVPSARSTVERAVQRLLPLRLLPDEREAVLQRAASDAPLLAVRAAAVARIARGEAPPSVAAALGVAQDDVERWADAVADHRLAALAPPPPPRRPYRVSALVGDGVAPPAEPSGEANGVAAVAPAIPAADATPSVRVVSPDAPPSPPAVPPDRPSVPPAPAALRPAAPDAGPVGRRDGRNPVGELDAPLTAAAAHALAHGLARLRAAHDRLTASPTARTALGWKAAAADLRLSLAAFALPEGAAVLAAAPVERLAARLAFVEARLQEALDADRASWLRTHREHTLLASRDAALADVQAYVRGPAWPSALALAERLVGRLRAQAADGVGAPDDGPLAATAPTTLRHVAGGVLWRRLEAVRALDGRVADGHDPATADALLAALDGVRHALGLVAWPDRRLARDLADRFAEGAAALTDARDAAVARGLAAAPRPAEALGPVLRASWATALAPDTCAGVAALAAMTVEAA